MKVLTHKDMLHKRERSEGSVDTSDNENGWEQEKRKKTDEGTEAGTQNVASVNGRKRLLFYMTAP